jgi:hypothetical protein
LGNTPVFNATITDNVSVASAQLFYRGVSRSAFKSAPLTLSGGSNYSVQIQSDWYDSLGLEYYFMATDGNGNVTSKPSVSSYAQLITPSISLPELPSGSDPANYRIIAFPFNLPGGNDVNKVYSNIPWNDDTKAGLWWWNPTNKNGAGGYDQYSKSPTLKTIDPGKGYWAITNVSATPQLTNVPAPHYNKANLFQMTLKPGWNEIGNPYPIPISWDDAITLNQKINPSAVFGKLTLYDGSSLKEATNGTLLNAFEGGFVKKLTSSDITIQVPFNGQVNLGGRESVVGSDLTQESWQVFLHITQNGLTNQLGGLGMHPQAKSGEDQFDSFNPPHFLEMPEVNFTDQNAPGIRFSREVVPTSENFVWRCSPIGVAGKRAELNWSQVITNGSRELFLFDEENLALIDMSKTSSYVFTQSTSSSFRIFFGRDVLSQVTVSGIRATSPWPNPLSEELKTTVQVALPDANEDYAIQMNLYSLQGEELGSSYHSLSAGIHSLEFNLGYLQTSGLYLYRLQITSGDSQKIYTGKLVKP